MKNVILAIILIILIAVSTTYAQTIVVDPNSIVIANGRVTVDVKLEISTELYEAMQYKGLTFADVFGRMNIIRYYKYLVKEVRLLLTDKFTIAELKELEK